MRIVVVGGGIGGLTAALALSRSGHEITVLERTSAVSELGAGLQMSANARRVLHFLGIADELAPVLVEPSRIVVRRWQDDRVITEIPLHGVHESRYGVPYANVSRHDLARVLFEAAAREPGITFRFACEVDGIVDDGSRTAVALSNGRAVDADVVIGADGIHSRARRYVAGNDTARFSSSAAYRALVPRDAVAHLPVEVTNRLGPGGHVVSYFIGRECTHLNLVCITASDWTGESWTEPADVASLRTAFADWSPELNVILDAVEEPVFRWALYDREPMDTWTKGVVTLLGDACHPMLPFMAQGACHAIEDAAVLARLLTDADDNPVDINRALRVYETTRRVRTDRVQKMSYANRIVYHLDDGPEQRARDEAMAARQRPDAFDWLYGYDPLSAPLSEAASN